MRITAAFVLLALCGLPARAQNGAGPAGQTPEFLKMQKALEDPRQGWQNLFNGKDLSNWKPLVTRTPRPNDWEAPVAVAVDPRDPTRLERSPWRPGGGPPALVNDVPGKSADLLTTTSYGDAEVYVEFLIPQKSNSGVCLMGNYEISIQDSYGKAKKDLLYGDTGGVYAFAYGSNDKRGAGAPPRVNAARKPGEWESFHIWYRAPRFDAAGKKTANGRIVKVEHNGVVVQEDWELTTTTRATPPWPERAEAPLLLQGDHGPVAFRNVYIRALR